MKPDRRLFEHVRQRAGEALGAEVAPADLLYVGDSFTSDVEGGVGAGWRVAWFRGDPERAPDGVFCFDDWRALRERLGA